VAVRLRVHARRFFCDNPHCPRRIFAERLAPLTKAYAQRTDRLKQAQTSIGEAVGSRPGVRLATHLTMPTSATTLLRLERTAPLPQRPTPRVLGVDDWAFRKGHHYGTILFDLEHRWVVDLLPDRKPETLAAWLKTHPGVEIVSRDRAEAYASGIRQGAPDAQQVTDRWHLVKNLGQALERVLEGKHALLQQAAQPPTEPDAILAEEITPPVLNPQHERLAQQKQCHRQERLERYQQARELFAKGWNISTISTHLNLSRKTVRNFVTASRFPERQERLPRPCRIDPFKAHLHQRWQEGGHNAAQLYEEIRQRGYGGGQTMVRDYLNTLRQDPTISQQPPKEKVSVRQVVMWTLRRETDRTPTQQTILDRLAQICELFATANTLAQQFLEMIRQSPRTDQTETFRGWLTDMSDCSIAAMRGYAGSLQQDQAAVEAGLSLPWSNGPVEGSNNRLKFLKRRGYGRAHFDLLRHRVLEST
jgi:transposase